MLYVPSRGFLASMASALKLDSAYELNTSSPPPHPESAGFFFEAILLLASDDQ